jgi:hypothetical protein
LPTPEPRALAQAPLSEQDTSPEIQKPAVGEVPVNASGKGIDLILILIGELVVLGTGLLLFGSMVGRQW